MYVPHGRPRQISMLALRVVIGAMAMGLIVFTAIFVGVLKPTPSPAGSPVLVYAPFGFFAVSAVMSVVLRQAFLAGWRKSLAGADKDDPRLLQTYARATLLSGAMFEGPGFFGLIVYMVTGDMLPLVVVPLAIVALALVFPTQMAFDNFRDACGVRVR